MSEITSESCSHDCSSCQSACASRKVPSRPLHEQLYDDAKVRHVIGIVSGKGGVGKSLVTSMLACAMQRRGYRTAVLDADLTGPSIPRAFGVTEKAEGGVACLYPTASAGGTQIMSMNLLLDNDTDPVIWRGPIIANMVRQMWSQVLWKDVDYMFVDMPPGTGDVPLTVFQSLPVDGAVLVTSPQSLVGMIVEKAIRMVEEMKIPVLGMVENFAYYQCPDCGSRHSIFGPSHLKETAEAFDIPVTASLPIDPAVAAACDEGRIESVHNGWLDALADALEARFEKKA